MCAHRGIGFARGHRRPTPGHGGVQCSGRRLSERIAAEPGCAAVSVGGRPGASRTWLAGPGEDGAHRGEGVAGDPAAPDQFPQRAFDEVLVGGAVRELAEEVRAPRIAGTAQNVKDPAVGVVVVELGGSTECEGCGVCVVEHHPAVMGGDCPGSRPGDFAGGQQLIEHCRLIPADPGREHQ